jgi:hypothetical protein
VAVGLGDGADRHLSDLGATAHDDHALAVDRLQGIHQLEAAHHGQRAQLLGQCSRRTGHLDLEVQAAAGGRVIEDLDQGHVTLVARDHAAQLVQHPGPGLRVHHDPRPLVRHAAW